MKKFVLLAISILVVQFAHAQFKNVTIHPSSKSRSPQSKLQPIKPVVPWSDGYSFFSKSFTPLPALPKPVAGASNLLAYIDEKTGQPFAIKGQFISEGLSEREKVINYLEKIQPVLKLTQPLEELQLTKVVQDELGFKHYRLKQVWKGIEIFGAEVLLHEKDGKFFLMNGRFYPTPNIENTSPVINEEEAIELAKLDIARSENVKVLSNIEKKLANYDGPEVQLVIYYVEGKPGNEKLAWSVKLMPNIVSNYQYFIDAQTGEVLHKFNKICKIAGPHYHTKIEHLNTSCSLLPPPDGPATANAVDLHGNVQTINTYEQSNQFYLIDASRAMFNPLQSQIPDDPVGVIITLNALNTSPVNNNFEVAQITSSDNTWNDMKAVSAHYNAGKAYEYYKNTFGRESINGEGGNIISIINVVEENGIQMDNAFWSGLAMFYGNGNIGFIAPLCKSLDVAGHEMTHGVIETTANLIYQDESGALNESFADIFGVMIDRDDWRVGEDVVNTILFPSGALRDISNPHNGGTSLSDLGWQPAHYSEKYTGPEDNGGVHINSGIVNKAFFLFASDPSVGKDKAEQVYYRALTQYLFSSSQFVDCRLAVVQSANDLFGSAVAAVAESAFDAVGIGNGGGSNPQTDIDPNPGEDFILMTDDSYSQLYILTPDGIPVSNPLSTNSPLSRPSVTDDGSVITFVALDNTIRAITIDWGTGQTNELVLSSEPIWRNVAIARDASRIAALTTDYDNLLWVYDFNLQQWQAFELYNPTTGQGGPITGDVKFADVIEWDFSGQWLMYDALNAIPTSNTQDIEYWDISFINVWDNSTGNFADGFTDKLFSVLPENVSVGNPTFSKNSDYIIAFDYLDNYNNEYFMLGANLETGNVGTIFQNSDLSWPNYSVDDKFIVFDAFDNNNTPVLSFVKLSEDKITPEGDPFTFIEHGRWGVWFANGERILVKTHDNSSSAQKFIYPNPTNNHLYFASNTSKGTINELKIIDGLGRIVQLNRGPFYQENVHRLDVSGLAPGIYYLHVKTENQINVYSFIKQ